MNDACNVYGFIFSCSTVLIKALRLRENEEKLSFLKNL